jgi:transposase InsO family protein
MDVKLSAAIADESLNVKRFCEDQKISRSTFYKWRDRYRREGLAGLEERSRRPLTVGPVMGADVEDRIVDLRKKLAEDGLDAGAATIEGHLIDEGWDPVPSEASIWRALTRRGFITPQPRKRPRSSYKTFVFERVNECWQVDHYDWYLAQGTPVQVINILDDHSRVVDSEAFPVVTCENAWKAFLLAADLYGFPGMVLSDNDLVYNGSLRNMTVAFEANLRVLGIRPITSRPYHPQTCGKVERYHQTEQKWLRARPPAETIEELNELLSTFNSYYNNKRKHRSLNGATPAHVHQTDPKAGPADRPITSPKRVTAGKVAVDGSVWSRPWRIAVGRVHAGSPVTTIIDTDQAYIFNGEGQLLRQLTLDPTRQNQPLGCPR